MTRKYENPIAKGARVSRLMRAADALELQARRAGGDAEALQRAQELRHEAAVARAEMRFQARSGRDYDEMGRLRLKA